ncbi:MAG: tetratricopeptide repeat protein [Bdellovibrionales bacterium]
MKNNLLLFTLTMVMLSCSSKGPQVISTSSSQTSNPEAGLVEMTTTQSISTEALPPVAVEPESKNTAADRLMQNLNEAIQKQDERKIAIASREILIREPENLTALNSLALFHYRKGQTELAKYLLNKAIALYPNVSLLYSNLGFIHQSLNEDGEAIRHYRKALQIDPSSAIAAANIGYLYLQKRDFKKAQVALEIAVDKGQRDWKTLSNYGVTLMALGQYEKSYDQLKKAVQLQSQNMNLQLNYAILLIEHMSRLSEGLEVINKIRFMGPGPDLRKKISELENRAKSVLK